MKKACEPAVFEKNLSQKRKRFLIRSHETMFSIQEARFNVIPWPKEHIAGQRSQVISVTNGVGTLHLIINDCDGSQLTLV